MTNMEWQARKEKVVAKGMANLAPIYAASAKNAIITDIDGKTYIDFAAGIAVNNTGHSHPQIIEAVKKQLDNFSHTCSMVTPYTSFVELAEKIVAKTPGNFEKKAAFVTTGAEAVENAVKIARAHTGRSGIIAFKGGFHGRTNMCMGLTGKVAPYKAGFGPFPNEIYHLPFPNKYHGVSEAQSLNALDDLFACDIEPSRIAAIIFEPIQGEGGFYQAPASWAQKIREICDKHGIVLICDEIQTGFARTGKMFATEYLGIEADLITMAKGIAGGFPLSGVVGKAEIMDAANPGGVGGTYAGSPLACVAALEVLDIIEKENLCERAQHIGLQFKEQLTELQKEIPQIGDIRQVGAMIAIELNNPENGAPLADLTKQLVVKSNHAGVILLSCGVKGNVIRFLPPLTIEPELIVKGLEIIKAELQALLAH
ncbi:4-aminobutyrate aminotransferase PuuE [Vibrio ruber DSM 16370]|uniref:4-aminobutyrate aminotransferase PuuE n=1 Tax=Vibrio ruber (strain DSM 16370 / JCM 11486 / BCRC 17186 / CECT 7878 / LMG 23124 / VR1) TaxID=1123498 RepID=A0A1R4L9W5_VIBR1|nr:4-aminobutyrate--2-oxoglutarate transaminase [Vibrio ruber]SJN53034.1 4-aminobutyrate aminotransferase PuuE [Vibrio ruber DSM 16370]